MTKNELAEKIVLEFLDKDMLDAQKYGNDIKSISKDATSIIARNLSDYIIVSGTVLE